MTGKEKKQNIKNFGSKKRIKAIKIIPCLICQNIPSENAHVKSRGAGGSKEDVVPLCHEHHTDLHVMGKDTFENKYEVDLEEEAERLAKYMKIYNWEK